MYGPMPMELQDIIVLYDSNMSLAFSALQLADIVDGQVPTHHLELLIYMGLSTRKQSNNASSRFHRAPYHNLVAFGSSKTCRAPSCGDN